MDKNSGRNSKIIVSDTVVQGYIADKSHDIMESIRIWQKHFPELNDDLIDDYTFRWMCNALLPNQLRVCNEKVDFYKTQLERSDISKTIKEIVKICLAKNLKYIKCIEEFTKRSNPNQQP